MEKKYHLTLDSYEQRLIVRSLNDLRNSLIAEERYTDAVDDLLLKIIDAKAGRCGWFRKGA